MSAYEAGVTWSRRLHYSVDLVEQSVGGRQGSALCNRNIWLYDEVAANSKSFGPGRLRPVDFARLPVCKRCAKKVGAAS